MVGTQTAGLLQRSMRGRCAELGGCWLAMCNAVAVAAWRRGALSFRLKLSCLPKMLVGMTEVKLQPYCELYMRFCTSTRRLAYAYPCTARLARHDRRARPALQRPLPCKLTCLRQDIACARTMQREAASR